MKWKKKLKNFLDNEVNNMRKFKTRKSRKSRKSRKTGIKLSRRAKELLDCINKSIPLDDYINEAKYHLKSGLEYGADEDEILEAVSYSIDELSESVEELLGAAEELVSELNGEGLAKDLVILLESMKDLIDEFFYDEIDLDEVENILNKMKRLNKEIVETVKDINKKYGYSTR